LVAYQLIVTRRGPAPDRDHPSNEWEFSNPRFNGQKRSEIRAIAIDLGLAEIWLGQRLVNGSRGRRFEALAAVAARFNRGFKTITSEDAAGITNLPKTRRSHVKDFIILTDFSRCQGPTIGRVSRGPKTALLPQTATRL
jgi:hypothetical protein